MAVTLKDIAALAGVSVKTVSNVVNGYDFVKPENRRRVQEAIEATGYRPNVGARNLRRGRTGFIALAVPELDIPYFAELAGLVITAAQRYDWTVLIEQTMGTREREQEVLTSMGPHLIDGAILSPEALQHSDFARTEVGVPLVLLGEQPLAVPIDHVMIDNVAAARMATAHLIELGRTRIAAIGRHPFRATAAQRLAGYHDALDAAGIAHDDELVVTVELWRRAQGATAMRQLLDRPNPPDAVFCFNDLLAVGAMRAAADLGLRVPGDVAVVGFDDIEEGRYSVPSLTTISPDKAAIATTAVDLLHERTDPTNGHAARTIHPPFTLTSRESTLGR